MPTCAKHVEGYEGGLTVRQFEGGQSNPTFALRAGSREYVLRKQPPGELLPSAHQVDREYRVMHALRDSDVPVPKMYALCEDTSVIGTKFYVMEKVAGRVFTDLLLPSMNNAERRAVYKDLARVLAALHTRRLSRRRPREFRQTRQLLLAPDLALEQAIRRVANRRACRRWTS